MQKLWGNVIGTTFNLNLCYHSQNKTYICFHLIAFLMHLPFFPLRSVFVQLKTITFMQLP